MKRRGFTLIELIMGLFLIGLIATILMPIVQNSIGNYNKVKERQHMLYLCEMVVERLRAKDANIDTIFQDLEDNSQIIVSTIGETDLGKYKCSISKTKETTMFMNLDVRIYIDSEMGNSQYVEYKTVIKK